MARSRSWPTKSLTLQAASQCRGFELNSCSGTGNPAPLLWGRQLQWFVGTSCEGSWIWRQSEAIRPTHSTVWPSILAFQLLWCHICEPLHVSLENALNQRCQALRLASISLSHVLWVHHDSPLRTSLTESTPCRPDYAGMSIPHLCKWAEDVWSLV